MATAKEAAILLMGSVLDDAFEGLVSQHEMEIVTNNSLIESLIQESGYPQYKLTKKRKEAIVMAFKKEVDMWHNGRSRYMRGRGHTKF